MFFINQTPLCQSFHKYEAEDFQNFSLDQPFMKTKFHATHYKLESHFLNKLGKADMD